MCSVCVACVRIGANICAEWCVHVFRMAGMCVCVVLVCSVCILCIFIITQIFRKEILLALNLAHLLIAFLSSFRGNEKGFFYRDMLSLD